MAEKPVTAKEEAHRMCLKSMRWNILNFYTEWDIQRQERQNLRTTPRIYHPQNLTEWIYIICNFQKGIWAQEEGLKRVLTIRKAFAVRGNLFFDTWVTLNKHEQNAMTHWCDDVMTCNSAVPSQCHIQVLGNERKYNHSKILLLTQKDNLVIQLTKATLWASVWLCHSDGFPIPPIITLSMIGRRWRGREREEIM